MNLIDDISFLKQEIERLQDRIAGLENENKELRSLQKNNKELEQFAHIASHDLQEPLRMITGYTQLLAKRYADRLDDNALEFINYTLDGSKRMHQLLSDLLSYSRVMSRGGEFVKIDTDALAGSVVSSMKNELDKLGAEVNIEPLPDISGDPLQIKQLFYNLLDNAVKFRSAGNLKISIFSRKIKDGFCEFCIKDNGIGIAPEFHERIFSVFQRLHTREDYPGTGMGLAIAKKIVERHEGTIGVESEEGSGSLFCFSLPIKG